MEEDRQLKAWLRRHRAAFEPDAAPREDAVGAWKAPHEAVEQPFIDTSAAAYADHLAALLRQQVPSLKPKPQMNPKPQTPNPNPKPEKTRCLFVMVNSEEAETIGEEEE